MTKMPSMHPFPVMLNSWIKHGVVIVDVDVDNDVIGGILVSFETPPSHYDFSTTAVCWNNSLENFE